MRCEAAAIPSAAVYFGPMMKKMAAIIARLDDWLGRQDFGLIGILPRQVSVLELPSATYAQVGHLFQVMPDGFLVELVGARDQIYHHGPVAPASCLR